MKSASKLGRDPQIILRGTEALIDSPLTSKLGTKGKIALATAGLAGAAGKTAYDLNKFRKLVMDDNIDKPTSTKALGSAIGSSIGSTVVPGVGGAYIGSKLGSRTGKKVADNLLKVSEDKSK